MFRGARKEELILIADELERAKLESERDSNELKRTNPETKQTSIENFILSVRTLTLPTPKKQEGWNLFFSSLERSFKTKNVPDEFKGEILLNLLGEKPENILVYVKDEEISDYNKLKSLVLREFEPTPLICLQNFQKAKRMPNETHVQLAYRLLSNWDQYCNLRNVNDFNSLKELIVSDKLYETLDNETAVHINIKQEQNWFKPIQMGKECDMFYACKGKSFSEFTHRACHNQNESGKDFKYIPPNARREVINLNSKENKFINSKQNEPVMQLVLPRCRIDKVKKLAQESVFGGHMGVKKTKERIKYNFFWPNMSGEIAEFVQTCKGCQLRKPEKIGDRAPITPIVRPELPFEIVNIDVIGPIQPPSGRGHKYVLCMMDQHTRWPEAVPLRSLTAKTACDSITNILEDWNSEYNCQ
ncbi:transposon Ty3-I Gag-Pol polyprotein [Trichonephila clavipes]|nr:transposon Ty3-I Gag-Pol polyprotein [Trichonephila clavipes]